VSDFDKRQKELLEELLDVVDGRITFCLFRGLIELADDNVNELFGNHLGGKAKESSRNTETTFPRSDKKFRPLAPAT
jgi:hypothetical protein